MMQRLSLAAVLGSLVVGLAVGCGGGGAPKRGPTGSVTGTVTFEGQPVSEGRVSLHNGNTGESGAATLGEGGKFTLPQPLAVGTYKVAVMPPQEPPPEFGKPYEPKSFTNIPDKYRAEVTTDITVEIKEGDNPLTIEMKK